MTAKKQVSSNPFIVPDSPYRCCAVDCFERGVWSATLTGEHWLCAKHAEMFQERRGELGSPAYAAFCEWWVRFKRNPPPCEYADQVGPFVRVGAVLAAHPPLDFEALEERRAIQAESES